MPSKKKTVRANGTRTGKFNPKNSGPDNNHKPSISKKNCIEALEISGPISDELRKKLNLPNKLYAKPGVLSFTSEPEGSMVGLMEALLTGMPIPENLPDYGIEINARGSITYGLLVDKTRGIIVMGDIMSAYDESGNWEFFMMGLDEAMTTAKSLKREGKEFLFIVNKELSTTVLK
ncbi:MAG: hypothetical protein ABH983_00785 [Candidatus Micrarchaeota archaeon]|nr:hypothetical protein [Candidatus Micrarchaeota archaeon]MBU1682044.1 hypothetical protein [Candidatus Micrarchaeota archaeon]